jgi:phosphoribosylaminoimidazole (AIR) synthetase
MEQTFNQGIGMFAVVSKDSVDDAIKDLSNQGFEAFVCGDVRDRQSNEKGDAAAKGGKGGAVFLTN